MLVRYPEFSEKTFPLREDYLAVVVSNNDPQKLGRIKCAIAGILEGDEESLPWAVGMQPSGLGGQSGLSFFAVPEVGAQVMVRFLYGDVYAPVYVGFLQNRQTHQPDLDGVYPESYGWLDSTGTKLRVDKSEGKVEIVHGPSGSTITLDGNGNLTITNPGNLSWVVGGNGSLAFTGNLRVTAARIDWQ